MGEIVVWEAGADQRVLQLVAPAHADAAIVEEGAAPAAGGVEVVAHRVIDHGL